MALALSLVRTEAKNANPAKTTLNPMPIPSNIRTEASAPQRSMGAPKPIKEAVDKKTAEEAKKKLEEAGAKAELK